MCRANLAEVAALVATAVGGSRRAAVVSKATWRDQRSVEGSIADIAQLADQAVIEAPATLIVGEVVGAVTGHILQAVAL